MSEQDKQSKRAAKEARRASKAMRKQRKTDEKHTLEAQLKEIAAAQSHKGSFHSLDNAALLFPSSETAARSNLFRLTAVMTQPVDPVALQWALNDLVPRFPTFTSAVAGCRTDQSPVPPHSARHPPRAHSRDLFFA